MFNSHTPEWQVYLLVIFCFTIPTHCYAQTQESSGRIPPKLEQLPPTPQAASLGKFGNVPVGYQTGIPNISLPLYTIALKDFNYPISLNYYSMGNRVDDVSTNVGLGWTLFATGSISTSTKGPTEDVLPADNWAVPPVGAQDPCDFIHQNTIYDDAKRYMESQVNWEGGIYNYNFAGHSGRFFIRPDWEVSIVDNGQTVTAKQAVTIPYQNLKIYILANRMLAIDENGSRYYLSAYESSSMSTTCYGASESPVVFPSENKSYFLSKIITQSKDTIDFSYATETYSYLHSRNQSMLRAAQNNNACDDAVPVNSLKECRNTMTVIDGLKLQSITASNGQRLEFVYSDRKDIYGTSKVDRIKVFDNTGLVPLKELLFSYSYFGGQPTNVEATDEINLKLRLDSFKESYNGVLSEPHSFQYYSGEVTPRVFLKQDYFGYPINGTIIAQGFPAIPSQPDIGYQGIDRTPSQTGSTHGVLQRITYPTKGYTQFEYELEGTGGVRIKYLSDYNYSSALISKRRYKYEYESQADTGGWSRFKSYTTIFYPSANPDLPTTNPANTCVFWSLSSNGQSSDYFGERRKYNYVEEIYEDGAGLINGKTSFKYGPEYTILPSSYFYNLASEVYLADQSFISEPLAEKIVWQLVPQTTNTWIKKHKIEYRYELTGEFEFSLKQFRLEQSEPEHFYTDAVTHASFCQPATFNYARFQYISTWYRLKKTIETFYDPSGTSSLVKEITNQLYNSSNLKENKVETISSNGDQTELIYQYPSDFTGVNPYTNMISAGVVGPVISARKKINGLTESEEVVVFSESNSIFKPSAYYSFAPASVGDKTNTPIISNPASLNQNLYYSTVSDIVYDASGNILQYKKNNGIQVTLLWGYNNQYIVARKEDYVQRSFYVNSFEDAGIAPTNPVKPRHGGKVLSGGNFTIPYQPNVPADYVITYWFYENSTWNFSGVLPFNAVITTSASYLDEVRVYPKNATITTYAYFPGIGVSSITDSNNRISYYMYDSMNRLEFIQDDDKNMVKKMDYQYKTGSN